MVRILLCWLLLGSFYVKTLEAQPNISFFTQAKDQAWDGMMEDSLVLRELRLMKASLRIWVHDLSERRANTLRQIAAHDIPMVAVFSLAPNPQQPTYEAFKEWSDMYELSWQAVGLWVAPEADFWADLRKAPWKKGWNIYQHLYRSKAWEARQAESEALAAQIKADGFKLETYLNPMIWDERLAGSKAMQHALQIGDVKADYEVPLLLSGTPELGAAAILGYGQEFGRVAIGDFVETTASALPVLNWEDWTQQLLLAHDFTKDIHIAHLEGLVARGWLSRIRAFNFQQPVDLYSGEIHQLSDFRDRLQQLLPLADFPLLTTIGIVLLGILAIWLGIRLLFWTFRAIADLFRSRRQPEQVEVLG
ncbi:MAG: hypothetical protein AAFR61_24115 [Bacteroidota bacterium]